MKVFGINGFGRIGRTALRVWWQYHRHSCALSVINTSGSMEVEDWAHLLKYDSNYGVFNQAQITSQRLQSTKEVTPENSVLGTITVDNHVVTITAQRDPKLIPWRQFSVDTVIESTGVFTSKEKASAHIHAGAAKVIISAPAKGDDVATSVISVNSDEVREESILSNASCTTNCVAPVAQVMVESFGVEKAMLTTIHAYTDDQNLHDNSHRDMRRARAAGLNIVPTSTGAALATGLVIPELKGIFDGIAVRVPVSVGSLSDMVFVTKREVSIEEVNQALQQASQTDRFRNILAVSADPLVSRDIVGRRESSIVDLGLTNVVGGNLVKIVSWYDNEWGYCNRLIEQIIK